MQNLNESQTKAVRCIDAPMLVIAGAGSGKTRVLTQKIAYLLQHGYQPWEIVALTFTNKAAQEMKDRIAAQVGQDTAARLWMGTFHSILYRILRAEAQHIGFKASFTIYDAADSKSLVSTIIKEMGLSDKVYKPTAVCGRISAAKNALVRPTQYAREPQWAGRDIQSQMPAVHQIYNLYCQRCFASGVMDFDDILLYAFELFLNNQEVRQRYAERFRYILVDEYQDTNFAQHRIVKLLACVHNMVCVVGDDAQSIYSFRGAVIDNILQFQNEYPGAKLFKLEQNYRSTQTIVEAANRLISHNARQIPKTVFSENGRGDRIVVENSYSDFDEAGKVSAFVKQFHRASRIPYSQIAILYRTNAQSRLLEEELRREGTPYCIYGGLSFYQRKEIKDAVAYFRLVVNPSDELSFRRIINYPLRGIGQTTQDKLIAFARSSHLSPLEAIGQIEESGLSKATQNKLVAFQQMIASFVDEAQTADAATLVHRIIKESGLYAAIFNSTAPEDLVRQENLQELVDAVAQFVQGAAELGEPAHLENFLQSISLMSETDGDEEDTTERVSLMTIHSAKGLEFDAVIVVGMDENLFPSQLSIDNPREIEEERRLCYVAITRAKRFLVLTHAKSRFRYGKTEFFGPSRFLHEIMSGTAPKGIPAARRIPSSASVTSSTSSAFSASSFVRSASASVAPTSASVAPTSLHPDAKVRHPRFGTGVVQEILDSGSNAKAVVQFEKAGIKKLFLQFAQLEIIE